MVNFTDVKIINKKHKKVICTCIFIVQENYLTYKAAQYVNGVIKSVETFPKIMGKDWIYRIYYDSSFDDYIRNGEYVFDTDIYKSNQNDNSYDKIVKEKTKENKDMVKFLMDWFSSYLSIIKDYPYIELIRYDYPPFHQSGYIGHPYTFASFIRFYGMFDENIDIMYSVNSSDPISKEMAHHIKQWDKSDKSICTFYLAYNPVLYDKHIFDALIDLLEKEKIYPKTLNVLKKGKQNHRIYEIYRFHAISGFKCKNNELKINGKTFDLNMAKKHMDTFINNNNSMNPDSVTKIWKYGIDEYLLSTLIFPLLDMVPINYKLINDIHFVNYELVAYDLFSPKHNILSDIILTRLKKEGVSSKKINYLKHIFKPLKYIRIRKLMGGKLLEKIYNKPANQIKFDYECDFINTWKLLSVFDEYKPKLFLIDYDPIKVKDILIIKDYIDITILTTSKQNKQYKLIDYSNKSNVISYINQLNQDLIKYYRKNKIYIDVVNNINPIVNEVTLKTNRLNSDKILEYKKKAYQDCLTTSKKGRSKKKETFKKKETYLKGTEKLKRKRNLSQRKTKKKN